MFDQQRNLVCTLPLLISAILGLGGCKGEIKQAAPEPPTVFVQTLAEQTTPITVDLVAEIKAFREVDLYSRVSGQIVKQTFKPGQKVKEGDLLFSVDPRAYDEAIIDA